MYFHQICKCTSLYLVDTHVKAHGLNLCCFFYFQSACVLAYVTIGSYVSCMSTNYTLATVYKVIDEPAHVAVGW